MRDVPRPVKRALVGFEEHEERVLTVIATELGLPWPMPEEVLRADDVLLATEARDLMSDPPEPWPLRADPLDEAIVPLPPRESEEAFLARFHVLSA